MNSGFLQPLQQQPLEETPSAEDSLVLPIHVSSASKGRRQFRSKYTCHICDNKFTTKHNLDQHIRAHIGVKPFTCTCGQTFTTLSDRSRHQRNSLKPTCKGVSHDIRCNSSGSKGAPSTPSLWPSFRGSPIATSAYSLTPLPRGSSIPSSDFSLPALSRGSSVTTSHHSFQASSPRTSNANPGSGIDGDLLYFKMDHMGSDSRLLQQDSESSVVSRRDGLDDWQANKEDDLLGSQLHSGDENPLVFGGIDLEFGGVTELDSLRPSFDGWVPSETEFSL